ncbi:hypothetical protein JTL48_33305, partial [Pseudomonas aeruginosa]|nr:hypothetical protein [Pseudomonas aeruginosa]
FQPGAGGLSEGFRKRLMAMQKNRSAKVRPEVAVRLIFTMCRPFHMNDRAPRSLPMCTEEDR